MVGRGQGHSHGKVPAEVHLRKQARSCAPALQLTLCDVLLAPVNAGPSSSSVPLASVAGMHARGHEGSCASGDVLGWLIEHEDGSDQGADAQGFLRLGVWLG